LVNKNVVPYGAFQHLQRAFDNVLYLKPFHQLGLYPLAHLHAVYLSQGHLHVPPALLAGPVGGFCDLAERLVRQHTLDLAAHVEKSVTWLD
jgi:hypothetical protein